MLQLHLNATAGQSIPHTAGGIHLSVHKVRCPGPGARWRPMEKRPPEIGRVLYPVVGLPAVQNRDQVLRVNRRSRAFSGHVITMWEREVSPATEHTPPPRSPARRAEPNCFTAEVAEAAERATDARKGRESQEKKYAKPPCCHGLELWEIEGFLCVLGALCGRTATFGLNQERVGVAVGWPATWTIPSGGPAVFSISGPGLLVTAWYEALPGDLKAATWGARTVKQTGLHSAAPTSPNPFRLIGITR